MTGLLGSELTVTPTPRAGLCVSGNGMELRRIHTRTEAQGSQTTGVEGVKIFTHVHEWCIFLERAK